MADINYLEELSRIGDDHDVMLSVPSECGFYRAALCAGGEEMVVIQSPALALTAYAFVEAVLALEDGGVFADPEPEMEGER